jgi:shikimate kinase|tara:strand:- start:5209 stop:5706 length:498 start_codon:yes stop_codon:yes gene_type:complete
MRIFLIGFMGSGKTTLGKELSKDLGLKFIDLDTYIENKIGMTITDIFNNKGEEKFRIIEKECLIELSTEEHIVIATGGGTPCFYNNMQKILDCGISIYLKTEIQDLLKRLEKDRKGRPLIQNKSINEIKTYIKNQLPKRDNFYKQSDYTIDAKDISVEIIKEKIF